jgi:hypothetical protein
MASGFITLPNGQDWSRRWTGYDLVLETIMNALSEEGDAGILKKWLQFILPNEEEGDIESGWGYIKKMGEGENDFECLARILDTRWMKPHFKQLFWEKVAEINLQLDIETPAGYLINDLHESYQYSLKDDAKAPTNKSNRFIFTINGFDIAT